MIEMLAVGVCAVVAGFFAGYKRCSHLYAKEVRAFAAETSASEKSKKLSEESSKVLAAELDKVTKKLEAALSTNYNFEKSRDEAWDLYRRSAISAGNAQSLLFRKIQELVHLVNKYKRKLGEDAMKTPEDLETMISEFKAEHIEEAKRKAQQL